MLILQTEEEEQLIYRWVTIGDNHLFIRGNFEEGETKSSAWESV